MMGYLNYDVWHWIVGYLVDDMRIRKDFPLYPDVSSWCTIPWCSTLMGVCTRGMVP